MLLTLLACASEEPVALQAGSIGVTLVNPTLGDPWEGVERLRVELEGEEGVFESATFGVDEALELPGIERFGRIHVSLKGFDAGGAMVSYGRTADLLVAPEQTYEVPMLFLPVDRELLLERASVERSEHVALPLEDGSVLLLGGGTVTVERFSLEGIQEQEELQKQSSRAAWARTSDRSLLVVGGLALVGDTQQPVRMGLEVDPQDALVSELTGLEEARVPVCFTVFRPDLGLVLGTEETVETLRLNPDSGGWEWTRVLISDLDGSAVDSCVTSVDGRVVMLGESSGIFDFRAEQAKADDLELSDAFAPAEIEGKLGVALSTGLVWTDAGVEVDLDTLAHRTTVVPLGTVEQVALVRTDVVALLGPEEVEILDLYNRVEGPFIGLSPREGARLTPLPDGTLLISGPSPALVRPRPLP